MLYEAPFIVFASPPSVARRIKDRSFISFCVIFEKLVVCFFGYIQNSYGCDGAHGQNAINPSVWSICLGPLVSVVTVWHIGHIPFSFSILCAASASCSITGGMVENVTTLRCW